MLKNQQLQVSQHGWLFVVLDAAAAAISPAEGDCHRVADGCAPRASRLARIGSPRPRATDCDDRLLHLHRHRLHVAIRH